MERRQDAEGFHSDVTENSGSFSGVLSTFTSPDLGPSHSGSGVGSTSTGISSTIPQPATESSSSSPTSLAEPSASPSSTASTFSLSKGAMAGLFTGLGVLILSICGVMYFGCIRRRQRYSKQQKRRDMRRSNVSVTFSTIMRRFDANPANPTNRGSEPRQTLSIQQAIPRSAPSHRISVPNVSGWWARRRERQSSQFHHIFYHSHPPSVIDDETKHLGEETRWTLGKVLENQRQQVITPIPPVPRLPITRPKPARNNPRARSSRGRMSVGESEGGQFTLEDALLPSLSPSSAAYELGSSRSGRHPYARA